MRTLFVLCFQAFESPTFLESLVSSETEAKNGEFQDNLISSAMETPWEM